MHRGHKIKNFQRRLIYHEDFALWIRSFARANGQRRHTKSLYFLHQLRGYLRSSRLVDSFPAGLVGQLVFEKLCIDFQWLQIINSSEEPMGNLWRAYLLVCSDSLTQVLIMTDMLPAKGLDSLPLTVS